MERIDTTTPHGHTTTIPVDQFLMLMYDIAEEMLYQHSRGKQISDERFAEMQIEYAVEAKEILIRNGILKGE